MGVALLGLLLPLLLQEGRAAAMTRASTSSNSTTREPPVGWMGECQEVSQSIPAPWPRLARPISPPPESLSPCTKRHTTPQILGFDFVAPIEEPGGASSVCRRLWDRAVAHYPPEEQQPHMQQQQQQQAEPSPQHQSKPFFGPWHFGSGHSGEEMGPLGTSGEYATFKVCTRVVCVYLRLPACMRLNHPPALTHRIVIQHISQ